MNILLVTTRLNIGGIGVYTLTLARALKKRGENVYVASSGGELAADLKEDGIEHINIPIDTSADIGLYTIPAYLILASLVRERAINVIHAQTRVAQVIASIVSGKTGVPFISTCHGFFKEKLARKLFPCWGSRVLAISDAVREHLVNDFKVPKEIVRLVYNGIDVPKFDRAFSDDDKNLIRSEYGLKDGPVIGIIARLSDVKGHEYLIGAFSKVVSRFPDAQLLVVGDGPKDYAESLKKLAKVTGVGGRVIFHGSCKDTSLPLSVIDIFCMPSVQEGLGLSILEAMAAGRAVVASDVGGIYSLISHNNNGLLVAPKDANALAEAIMKLLSEPETAKKMGEASKDIVRGKFTLDIMTDKVIDVYREVAGSRQPGETA